MAIDRINPCSLNVDQIGNPRPRGIACDVGAYEAPGGGPPPARRALDFDGDGRADIAFYDPPSGQILARPSGGGATIVKGFGVAGGDASVGKRPTLPGYPY